MILIQTSILCLCVLAFIIADGHLDECGHHIIRSGSGHDPPIHLGTLSPEVVSTVESR